MENLQNIKIRSIKKIDNILTIDYHLEPHELYFSNNILSHNCHSPHTWNKDKYNIELTADQVINDIKRYRKYITGITLTGGDPLFQIKDIYEFLRKLRADKELKDINVWLYTGYEFEDIPKSITTYLDVIKCGQFIKELEPVKWAGSSNQRIFRKRNETINGNHWILEEKKNE